MGEIQVVTNVRENALNMTPTNSANPPRLDRCDRQNVWAYYHRAWHLEDHLWQSLVGTEPFYLNPDSLRNLLIFYLGHSAAFYINKLLQVGLLEKPLNPVYEERFAVGVDPEKPQEIEGKFAQLRAVELASVWQYRQTVYNHIADLIQRTDFAISINSNHPLWALMMAIEHQYIHIETSSVLIRQLPAAVLRCPDGWKYYPDDGYTRLNEWISVPGGTVHLGKSPNSSTYGWDIEYGARTIQVEPFQVNKYLITNADFLEFIKAGGYENPVYWTATAWEWKTQQNINHPKFWVPDRQFSDSYQYRAMFDEIEMPFNYPVEVNYYEAIAYCHWYNEQTGQNARLMTEIEWHRVTYGLQSSGQVVSDYNLNLQWGSPNPVGTIETAQNAIGICDLRGNVWEWLSDHLTPLSGYEPHPLYEDYSAPYFDNQHQMMAGGSWVTCGTQALPYYRNWFRPNFYQHAGFRLAQPG